MSIASVSASPTAAIAQQLRNQTQVAQTGAASQAAPAVAPAVQAAQQAGQTHHHHHGGGGAPTGQQGNASLTTPLSGGSTILNTIA